MCHSFFKSLFLYPPASLRTPKPHHSHHTTCRQLQTGSCLFIFDVVSCPFHVLIRHEPNRSTCPTVSINCIMVSIFLLGKMTREFCTVSNCGTQTADVTEASFVLPPLQQTIIWPSPTIQIQCSYDNKSFYIILTLTCHNMSFHVYK